MKIHIPYRSIHIVAFLFLAFLCYQSHQLVRHLAGAALCGGFGRMTFTITTTRQPCKLPTLITLSGPVWTFALSWLGMVMLDVRRFALWAYALIFASFAPIRWIQTLSGRGDELILAQQWFGTSNRWFVALVALLIGLPPLIVAYRRIANHHYMRVWLGSLLLLFPLLFVLLISNQWLFGADGGSGPPAVIFGAPLIVLMVDLIAIVLLAFLAQDARLASWVSATTK
jgi:hypothetical protein